MLTHSHSHTGKTPWLVLPAAALVVHVRLSANRIGPCAKQAQPLGFARKRVAQKQRVSTANDKAESKEILNR